MRGVVEHPDGRREEFHDPGENFGLGLGGALIPCICGQREFVDSFSDDPPAERDPDRVCSCGRKYWYYDDEAEQAGGLTAD